MINKYTHKNVTWVDFENPTLDEVREIAEEFNIDPLVANELLSPTVRPRVDYYKDYIYLILHFPNSYNTRGNGNISKKIEEVDFIVGKDFVITTRYNAVDALLEFSKVFEVQSILDKSNMGDHAGYIFFYMIQHLYKSLMNRLETIRDLLDDIEKKIFEGEEKEMVLELSKINRLLLNYKESTSLHKEILESFEIAGKKFFGMDFDYHLRGILGEYYKVEGAMQGAKEYLNELRDTNDSLLTTKQNEIMKILTVTAFITFPLTLIAGIFGMNTISTPIIGNENDFITVLLIMLLMTILMAFYFRMKKWF